MSKLIIYGGKRLEGKVKVSGSKNAILSLIPASLLIEGKIIFKNVPKILDVERMISILKYLGSEIILENSTLIIDNRNIGYKDLLIPEVKTLRASVLFLGPILAKFGKIKTFLPGGDVIGARPLSTHFRGLQDLGANIFQNGETIEGKFKNFKNSFVILKEISVTASETLIMFSAFSKKDISLRMVATEPHVQVLCAFLNKAGFEIKGIGTPFLKIKKGKKIKKEVIFENSSDYVEAGTFIALGGATKSKIIIEKANPNELDAVFSLANEMNLKYEVKKDKIFIYPSKLKGTKIQTGLYPKFATDLQPPFGVLATQAEGASLIHEWMYENRFSYLKELKDMGANVEIFDPHRALIIGPTSLFGKEVESLDIRAGISLIIAGLIAEGKTIINEAEKIDRGYERIEEKLKNLGAEIERK